MKKKVAFYTAGCRLNQSETAVLTDRFTRMGYQKVPYGEATDLLVLNTCTVTENAEADCRRVIRRTLRHSPKAFVAVTGCYAQTGLNTLQHLPGVDLVLGNQYKMLLPDYLEEMPHVQKRSSTFVRHSGSMSREDFIQDGVGEYATTRANLKIQDGCNFMCSFCLIPFARGRERSRLSDDAVREAERLVERGHRELVLTGVNIGRFANGSGGLLDLIQRLERIPGLARIRISSIEPTTIPPALIEYMSTSRKLCRFLHVPLQSGHDEDSVGHEPSLLRERVSGPGWNTSCKRSRTSAWEPTCSWDFPGKRIASFPRPTSWSGICRWPMPTSSAIPLDRGRRPPVWAIPYLRR